MKLVVDIDENLFVRLYNGDNEIDDMAEALAVLCKGTPMPKGKWIHDYDDFYRCSLCGRGICTNWSLRPTDDFPFCHCGADMKGEEA